MNVTPSPKMFEAMTKFTDALVGEEPGKLETTAAARKRRSERRRVMDFLHNFARLTMRVGVQRYFEERGLATMQDPILPSALKPEHHDSGIIASSNDG